MYWTRESDPNYDASQGMVDGSASKPALRQDPGYMVEKTDYDIAPYFPKLYMYSY